MRHLLLILLIFVYTTVVGQFSFSRIEADVSIKEILPDGTQSITIGKVYYDKNYKQLIYDFTFPANQKLVIDKKMTLIFVDGELQTKKLQPNEAFLSFSIFETALNNDIQFYGLDKTPFKLVNTEKKGNQTVTTWQPPEILKKYSGDILLRTKDHLITGIVTLDKDKNVASKQLYSEYQYVNGVNFPTELLEISGPLEMQLKKRTSFSNILINNYNAPDTLYHISLD